MSTIALSSFITVVVVVLAYLGFPMAGGVSALIATGLATTLTLAMAYAFSHHPAAGRSH